MKKLIAIAPTVAKLKPVDSVILDTTEKINIPKGSEFEILESIPAPGPYLQVRLKLPLIFGGEEFFICLFYSKHTKLVGEEPKQKQVKLKVPYRSQTDNYYNPTGSCNVTSIAMCLEFFGVQPKTHPQLEDELYSEMEELGLSRHSPIDLAQIVARYGCRDKLVTQATIKDVQRHLESGNPAVTHGYFTAFGHIIALVGYDEKGFIVHDPYGEWFASGYDRNDSSNNEKGKFLHYSYDLIERTCMPDGDFWVHFITK